MSNSLTALYLSHPELANALRKQQAGQALMQQGMDSSPVQSPWQGVSRLAAALVGGYETGQAEREFKEAGAKRSELLASLLSDDTAPEMPQAPSQMPQLPRAAIERPVAAPNVPANLSDDDLLVRTTWGEGRGETPLGQQAVASVIRNRARAGNQSIRDVVLAPGQFEPWGNAATRQQMLDLDPNSPEYQRIAQAVLGTQNDPTGGATHFYSPTAQAQFGRPAPAWAQGQGTDIGNHRFYKLPYAPRGGAPQGGDVIPVVGGTPGGQGAPQAAPQDDFLRRAEQAQRKAMVAAAAGEKDMAQQFQNQAVTYRQMAMQRPQTSQTVVADPSSRTGYRYVPSAQAGGMEAPEPRPNVSIENKGEGTWESTRAKDFAERVKGWEDAGVKSTQTLTRLTRMEAMLDNVTTGAGSQTSITAGQLAQRLGVPEATMSALGIDPKTVAQGEAIRSLASQMLVGMLGAGGFPTNNFSDADRKMLEAALPGLQKSPAGNRMIVQILRAGAQRDLEIGQAWRAWSRVKGDSLASVRDFQAERLPQITERDIVAPLLEQGGWQDANPTGQGAQPALGGVTENATATNPQTGQKLIFRGGKWEAVQ